jgi:hypothetical protein
MTKSKSQLAATAPAPQTPRKSPREGTKFASVIALLEREGGATIFDLQTATSWQEHSVRGVLAGALKTRFGLTVTSEKLDGVRVYRAASAAAAP